MIKKIVIVLVFLIICFGLWFVFSLKSNDGKTEVFMITESRYILNNQDERLKLHYFTKKNDYKLFSKDDLIYLHNKSETIKFLIDLIEIKSYHNEIFFEEIYYGYEMILTLPLITDSYYIEDCYISWNQSYQTRSMFIGELFVESNEDIRSFPFQGLEGIKGETPRLSQIIVNIKDDTEISNVTIGPHEIPYFVTDDLLVLNMPEITYLFWDTYVKISTTEGDFYLPQFVYFRNYELLRFGMFERYVI